MQAAELYCIETFDKENLFKLQEENDFNKGLSDAESDASGVVECDSNIVKLHLHNTSCRTFNF